MMGRGCRRWTRTWWGQERRGMVAGIHSSAGGTPRPAAARLAGTRGSAAAGFARTQSLQGKSKRAQLTRLAAPLPASAALASPSARARGSAAALPEAPGASAGRAAVPSPAGALHRKTRTPPALQGRGGRLSARPTRELRHRLSPPPGASPQGPLPSPQPSGAGSQHQQFSTCG